MQPLPSELIEAAALPYRGAGRYAWNFAKGKLRHDPVFAAVLRLGMLPGEGSLVDLGCGQGLLLSLLAAAKAQHAAGRWPRDWPAPPARLALRGIDAQADRVRVARDALGASARIDLRDLRDLRDLDLRPCSAITLLDVLLYMGAADQERVIEKAAAALEPGGLLLLREPDAGAGFAYHATKWGARLDAALRGRFAQKLCCRSAASWKAELERRGLAVEAQPMSQGTLFANVLFAARKVV